jgi:hypothetical protein
LIFGGSVGNYLKLSKSKTKHGYPLIDYTLVLQTLPLLLAGAIFGVSFNNFLPDSFVCLLLVGV